MNEQHYLDQLDSLWKKNWPAALPREPEYPFGEILVTEYLQRHAQLTPDKACVIWYGTEITFRQLNDSCDRFASFLAECGMKKGDRVAVFLPSCPQFYIAFYGILKLGCVVVPVNPMFKEEELLFELNDTQAKLIVALDQLFPLVQKTKRKTGIQHIVTTNIAEFLPDEPAFPVHSFLSVPRQDCPGSIDMMSRLETQSPSYPDTEVDLDDVVALNYTGGTTGVPKACEHTQRDMIYTCANTATFGLQFSPGNVALSYFPFFWITGEVLLVLMPVFSGVTHIPLGRWDSQAVLTAIDKYRVTTLSAAFDNVVELMQRPDLRQYDLTSIELLTVASMVKRLDPEFRQRWKELTGSIVREAPWGTTETNAFDTFTSLMHDDDMDLKARPAFVGLPMPGTRFKIVSFETGKIVPLGDEGEIWVRTPSMLKSYWNKPEETERCLQDGWFRSGDNGVLDQEGYLHFLGRKKEMIKVKGMSVFPPELEAIISRHSAVTGCGVVGIPDEEKGEIPVAFVQLDPEYGGACSDSDLKAWCVDRMAVYKVPEMRIIEELPRTATGKIDKQALFEQFRA